MKHKDVFICRNHKTCKKYRAWLCSNVEQVPSTKPKDYVYSCFEEKSVCYPKVLI